MLRIAPRPLPEPIAATEPAEEQGSGRDDVRLMVSRPGSSPTHHRFADLTSVLVPGDALVVNTSATLPAALEAVTPDGTPIRLHLSTPIPGGLWVVEPRLPDGVGSAPLIGRMVSDRLLLPGGGEARLLAPHPVWADPTRLWTALLDLPGPLHEYLDRHGSPIRYSHATGAWPIAAYQTVFATVPGSAEMPSAGRPFTPDIVFRLVNRGVIVVPLVLHTGVSSLEAHEPPQPEWFEVPPATARAVNSARQGGGRIVAVGTTVVRALETVADNAGVAHPGRGWTDHIVHPDHGVRLVQGLLTGWHEPGSSHLDLLEAVAGRDLVEVSYQEAIERGYLWHEFGDVSLLLP
jgi:S-adenosylmethionine:tRNA ribosyltransferase-isomerase